MFLKPFISCRRYDSCIRIRLLHRLVGRQRFNDGLAQSFDALKIRRQFLIGQFDDEFQVIFVDDEFAGFVGNGDFEGMTATNGGDDFLLAHGETRVFEAALDAGEVQTARGG